MLIKLNNVERAEKYLNIVEQFHVPIDINSGSISIDGKSIGSIFGLDLNRSLDVIIHTKDKNEEENFYKLMKEFQVND